MARASNASVASAGRALNTTPGFARQLRGASILLLWIGTTVLTVALSARSASLVACATGVLALGYVGYDVSRGSGTGITPMAAFALVSAATAFANMTGFLSQFGPQRSEYFIYADENHLYLAALLSLAGTVFTIAGFRFLVGSRRARALCNLLPKVRGSFGKKRLIYGGIAVAAVGEAAHVVQALGKLGALGALILLLPQLVIFILARVGAEERLPRVQSTALGITAVECLRALLFAYLRLEIAAPVIAFVLGTLLGSRSFRPFRSRLFVPVYAMALVFATYFAAFGAVRSTAGSGIGRLDVVMAVADQGNTNQAGTPGPGPARKKKQSIWGRLTNFNQLSQVGRIADEDGFLNGSTLEYLGYVFIPRFLWPDKPIVAKGGWFAWRIGQGWINRDGRYTNSINMTIPGEFYLNFGWPAVVIGCFLFGMLMAVMWTRASFWSGTDNVLGSAFGYYLFWVSLILGADLQIVVTITAVYLAFVGVGFVVRPRRHRNVGAKLRVPMSPPASARL